MTHSSLFRRGTEFLGCRFPILCGAMTWVSDPGLVAAVCNAGGFASHAGGNAPAEAVERQILRTRELTSAPFGVNLITISPAFKEQLDMVCRLGVTHVVFAGGIPRADDIQRAKASGAKSMCFAATASLADRLVRSGADALILEGCESGGHIGAVSLGVLLQEVLFQYRDTLPVFVAGGLATGRIAAHLLLAGAAGIQMGSVFVASEECAVHPAFKQAFIRANARDAVGTAAIDPRLRVSPVRVLKNKGFLRFGEYQLELLAKLNAGEISGADAMLLSENFWAGSLRKAAQDGDVDNGSVMAGQSVGLIHAVRPVNDIIQGILAEIDDELARVRGVAGDVAGQGERVP